MGVEKSARPTGSSDRPVRLPKPLSDDRRANTRYPLGLELRYFVLHRRRPLEVGSGRSVDISSSGLRFTAEGPLEPGLKVELAIHWPLLLEGGVPLKLVALGKVIWTHGTEAALVFEHHEFRTRGAALKAPYGAAGPVLMARSATAPGPLG